MDSIVTDKMEISWVEGEHVCINQCLCGKEHNIFLIPMGSDATGECPQCKRKFYFTISIYEVR